MNRQSGSPLQAEIIKQDGDILTVKLFDELTDDDRERFEIGGRLYAMVELFDPESITVAQRNHYWALIGDMEEYTGMGEDYWDAKMKISFMHYEMLYELPSVAVNQMSKSLASKFLEYIIIYCVQKGIPFRKDQFYLPKESSNFLYWMTMEGGCVVCGDLDSDLHHATNLVGMGNDRSKKKHWHSTFLSLCRTHHNEAHNLGLTEFMKKWIVKPIKLNERQYNMVVKNRAKNRRLQK